MLEDKRGLNGMNVLKERFFIDDRDEIRCRDDFVILNSPFHVPYIIHQTFNFTSLNFTLFYI